MIRYLALGDSYTIGEGVAERDTWPYRLAIALNRLRVGDSTDSRVDYLSLSLPAMSEDAMPVAVPDPSVAGTPPGVSVHVMARTGWTADELLTALDQTMLAPPYDLVSVLVGVNDQYRDREVDEHLPHFNTLLSQAIAYADGDAARVFVVSIPDWGVSGFAADDPRGPQAIARAIDAFNRSQRELCGMRDIAYVDITSVSREKASDAAMFVDDRLHPSGAQYARWLDEILPVASNCLA